MNPQTEQAHRDLKNLLLNGRILINGFPPTAIEMGKIIQGEQMMYAKAMQFEAEKAAAKEPKKKKE